MGTGAREVKGKHPTVGIYNYNSATSKSNDGYLAFCVTEEVWRSDGNGNMFCLTTKECIPEKDFPPLNGAPPTFLLNSIKLGNKLKPTELIRRRTNPHRNDFGDAATLLKSAHRSKASRECVRQVR